MKTATSRLLFLLFFLAGIAGCNCKDTNASNDSNSPTLENSYWKLVELNGKPVAVVDNQKEPHIILRGGEPAALGGSGGCNRLMGSYTMDGNIITFNKIAMTMMACPNGMNTEHIFAATLEGKKHWFIEGNTLLLQDQQGKIIARFTVQYM
jgi:heat shock protein HslJ